MDMPLELFIYIGLFALGLGLLGCFLGETDGEKRRLRSLHESRRYARDSWEVHPEDGRHGRR